MAAIIYFDEYDEVGGATRVVPREGDNDPLYEYPYVHMMGFRDLIFKNDKESAEKWCKENKPESYEFR